MSVRTLVTGTPLRLNTAALASATVRAASSGSAAIAYFSLSASDRLGGGYWIVTGLPGLFGISLLMPSQNM